MIEIKYATLYILTNKYFMKVNKVWYHATTLFKRERLYRPMSNLSSASAFVFILDCPLFCRLWLWLWYLPLSKKQINLEKIKITNWKKRNRNLIPFWGSEPRFNETGRFWCEPGRQFRFHTGLTNQVLNKLRGRTIKTVR